MYIRYAVDNGRVHNRPGESQIVAFEPENQWKFVKTPTIIMDGNAHCVVMAI